jgi:YD repeat-containing protein
LLTSKTDGNSHVTGLAYSTNGDLTSVEDANSNYTYISVNGLEAQPESGFRLPPSVQSEIAAAKSL